MSIEINPPLKTILKRLKLSGILATLPDRVAYARKTKLPELDFLELVLQDEVDRRDHKNLALRLIRAGFEAEPEAFGSFERKPGERVALVSDGVTNFLQAPDRMRDLLASDVDDAECARAVALAAMRGGAGDNVAVALLSGPV